MSHLLAVILALLAAQLGVAQQTGRSPRAASPQQAAPLQAQAQVPAPAPAPAPAPRASAPVLTLRQLVGQHMIFAYDGLAPPRALRTRIARGEAAGVILFARNVRSAGQVRGVVRSLQAIARPRGLRAPLLVMVDQEGGPVRRLPGGPTRAAADVGSSEQAREDGREAARVLRAGGANMDLAPVADVARPGAVLERERRVYGRTAAGVASRAAAFVAGLHDGGVRATAKHYPGFGAASVNTDDAPLTLEHGTGPRDVGDRREVHVRPAGAQHARGLSPVLSRLLGGADVCRGARGSAREAPHRAALLVDHHEQRGAQAARAGDRLQRAHDAAHLTRGAHVAREQDHAGGLAARDPGAQRPRRRESVVGEDHVLADELAQREHGRARPRRQSRGRGWDLRLCLYRRSLLRGGRARRPPGLLSDLELRGEQRQDHREQMTHGSTIRAIP